MAQLPAGYSARAWTLDDADATASLMNAYGQREYGRDVTEAESLRAQMRMPGIDLAEDTILVESESGDLVAGAFAIDLSAPHVRVTAAGIVRHEDQGKGIGRFLAEWIEARGRKAVDKAPDGARVIVMQTVDDRETAAKTLLEAKGYKVCRHFWRMAIDLGDQVADVTWPDGIAVATFEPESDLEPLFFASREAFRDHWGHLDGPAEEGLKRLRHQIATDPDFDPTLWFLAKEGADIAGISRVSPREGTDRTTGYVQLLGVLRPWRRRGLGLALLQHTFMELRKRGFESCALHVDSQSLTGATRLYERAGMSVSELNHAYELELRPGQELTTQSA